ncbi:MAG: hypothetical protein AAF266_12185 [Planctomycetota bacterium]
MTDRERWIVYPLLFLALGAALRDKLAKQTRAKQIVCEQLYLVDSEGRPVAAMTGSELRFNLDGGRGNGFIEANTIDGESLFERGQPVGTAIAARLYQQFLNVVSQLRVVPGRAAPNRRIEPKNPSPPSEASAGEAATPPASGGGPELAPPAEPTGNP